MIMAGKPPSLNRQPKQMTNSTLQPSVAVLLTCYNRKEKTLSFLRSLFCQPAYTALNADIYLLDDGSTDGTAIAVKDQFPSINVVTGSGNLYWAGGMRAIWQHAIDQKKYDLFLLFNDDVLLKPDSIANLLNAYDATARDGVVLIGSTLSPVTNKLSYGGHRLYKEGRAAYYAIKPDEHRSIPCQIGNANVLLVDSVTVNKIGIFSAAYTHYLADFDYTLTAVKSGLEVLLAPGYYGYCEDDHGVNWLSTRHPLKRRIEYLYDVKGLAYKEYLHYIKKHFPADYAGAFAKLWLKTLFPVIWDKFKRRDG